MDPDQPPPPPPPSGFPLANPSTTGAGSSSGPTMGYGSNNPDSRKVQRSAKKMQWNLDSGLKKLDMFEKFEQGFEDKDKEGKEKKGDGEEENTDKDPGELSDKSYSDDGDYNENEHFDDDKDDYNLEDDHDDEPIY